MKEMEEDTQNIDISPSPAGRISVVKMPLICKISHIFNIIPTEVLIIFVIKIEGNSKILTILQETRKS